jgi:predicted Fe-S protein YdhL (DUF1289 family)
MVNIWDRIDVVNVESPCTGRCFVSSTTGYCDTCGLSIKEISEWNDLSDGSKEMILKKIEKRKKGL